jgi:predicted dithiol-disulfide oxidoreductase (DUF899 family)
MTSHKVTTREEWLAVRGELLAKEKRRHDEYHEAGAAGR